MKPGKPNLARVLLGGLIAGLVINVAEYLVHGVLLDPEWAAAFGALGRTPTGWTTFLPSNFLVGIIGIWIYAKFRPNYGPGPRTALRSAISIWAIFWAIPMMALQPMHLFPPTRSSLPPLASECWIVSQPFWLVHGCIARDLKGAKQR